MRCNSKIETIDNKFKITMPKKLFRNENLAESTHLIEATLKKNRCHSKMESLNGREPLGI
jgi:hypothetical protein